MKLANKRTNGAGPGIATIFYAMLAINVTSHALADFVINDDLIVDGSACIGFDCVNGESFSFDTIRLKENNLRIKFDDTSVAASFPRTDWQLTANASANGGQAKFSIDDISGGRTPFTVEANAPSHSLYVDDGGRVGFGTATPATELHAIDGDTPALRLEQDGGSGFAPQTWDVAGNETNFFVRDVSNSSALPFRIRPGAGTNAVFVDTDSSVGMGTASPDGSLHIVRTGTEAATLVIESTGASPAVKWEIKANESTGRLTFKDLNGTTTPFKFAPNADENLFRIGIVDSSTVDINGNLDVSEDLEIAADLAVAGRTDVVGDMEVGGNLVVFGQCVEADGACADYVFEPDYQLASLQALSEFISKNKHLPNVPSAKQIEEQGINLAHFTGRLLEKIEELTLYVLQQNEEGKSQQETISTLREDNRQLAAVVDDMAMRLRRMEQAAENAR